MLLLGKTQKKHSGDLPLQYQTCRLHPGKIQYNC